jgi:2-hydroxychromene-2-carboxylate isomerase
VNQDAGQTFFYDLSSPFAYLASHRVDEILPTPPAWQPVWIAAIITASGREWRRPGEENLARQMDVERRAAEYGLPPVRWPQRYLDGRDLGMDIEPINSLPVMRLATFAHRAGMGKEFARGVYHLTFGEGHDPAELDDAVFEVAAACGLDPDEARAATSDPDIKGALKEATEYAIGLGVFGLPTVTVGGELFWGDDRLEDAAAAAAALT